MKTQRRPFLKSLVAFAGALGISIPFLSFSAKNKSEGFAHVVYFWLENPDDVDVTRQFVDDIHRFLKKIDVIQSKFVGKPSPSDRSVVDGSYTISLVLMFKNKKDQDIYQAHPDHRDFADKTKGIRKKTLVYDSISA